MPAAIAANLEQLHFVPDGARVYLRCGDDDAHAFARRIPAAIERAAVLFLDRQDALVLTGADTVDAALDALGEAIGTVMVAQGANGTIARVDRERVETPSFQTGPAVDTTGDRDLLCAAYAWADLRGAEPRACLVWAQLYADLAMTVPTATAGAVTEARLLEEGIKRGFEPPPRVQPR